MITTDQTLEMLPHVIEIMDKTGVEDFLRGIIESGVEPKAIDAYTVLKHVLKNAASVKSEIAAVVSILKGISTQEALKLPITESIQCIKSLFEDEELRNFFTSLL